MVNLLAMTAPTGTPLSVTPAYTLVGDPGAMPAQRIERRSPAA
jgi:hypothetical protein